MERKVYTTKADIIEEVSRRTGLSKADTRSMLEATLDFIRESVVNDYPVQVRGFGTFLRRKRAAKMARDISKNTSITIPPHEVPAFKPSKEFVSKIKSK